MEESSLWVIKHCPVLIIVGIRGEGVAPPRMLSLIHADQSFSGKHSERIAVEVPVGDVSVDGIGNAGSFDARCGEGVVRENPGSMAKFTCGLFNVIELNHFALCEPFLKFSNHGEFGSQKDRIDGSMGLGDHVGRTLHINVVSEDNVSSRGGGDDGGHNCILVKG